MLWIGITQRLRMIEINLLPWRAYRRQQQKKSKILLLIGSALFVGLLVSGYLLLTTKTAAPQKKFPHLPQSVQQDMQEFQHIQFVGYLHQQDRTWGVLQLANGVLHEVQLGEKIANTKATVLMITQQQLVIGLMDHQRILFTMR
jgi:Tfp pilus assembly protein PilN